MFGACKLSRRDFLSRLKLLFLFSIIVLLGCENNNQTAVNNEKLFFPSIIDFWAYIFPGCSPTNKKEEIIKKYTTEFDDETSITLDTYIQEWSLHKEKEFWFKMQNAVKDRIPPDLIYTDSNSIIKRLISHELLVDVNPIIRENAEYIYNSFPKSYWNYRKEQGNVYSIPLHSYNVRFDYGFWVIKKEFLEKYNLQIETNTDLLKVLSHCQKPDPEDMKHWYRNTGEDLALFLSRKGEDLDLLLSGKMDYNSFDFLVSLFGMEFMDQQAFLFDHTEKVWKLVHQLDKKEKEIIKTISSLDFVTMRASYENITRIPWSVLHMPYNESLYPVGEYQLDNLQKLFSNGDYVFVHDYELAGYLPSEFIKQCFILKENEECIQAVHVLDAVLQTKIPLDVFLFEKESEEEIYQPKLHEVKTLLFLSDYYILNKINLSFDCFFNIKFLPMYDIFPKSVSEKYSYFLDLIEKGPSAGMNVYLDYREVMQDRNHLVIVEGEATREDRWHGYVPRLNVEDILFILDDPNNGISILRPYEQTLKEVKTELQERTDLYLKLSLSDE